MIINSHVVYLSHNVLALCHLLLFLLLSFQFARARGDSSAAYLFAGLANGQLAVFDPCVIQVL